MVLSSIIQCFPCYRDSSEDVGAPPESPLAGTQLDVPGPIPTTSQLLEYPQDIRPPDDLQEEPAGPLALSPSQNPPIPVASLETPAPEPLDAEGRRLLDYLREKSSLEAVSYAEARADEGRCHPETRVKVLNDLEAWSAGEGPWKDVELLILTAPAGHGKSAIMQTFSDRVVENAKENDTRPVIATFFFKATVLEQNQPKALVTTLAHQIAAKCPSLQHRIVAVIRGDTGIFSASLEYQMKHLLVEPIASASATSPSPPVAVICAVDGLDECNGEEVQSRVIRLLHTLSTTPRVRIVLASRPEYAITTAIQRGMSGMLHVDLNKGDTAEDIYKFVWAKLVEIRIASRLKIDPLTWPSEGDARELSDYSSGQFILAATAMRYVGDRRHDPKERLREVLTLCKPWGATGSDVTKTTVDFTQAFGALDTLFTRILENAGHNTDPKDPKQGQLKLACLVWMLTKTLRLSPFNFGVDPWMVPLWVLEESLGLQRGGITRELTDLHSLLEVPEDPYSCDDICAHHKSFLDFLGDPRRSGHLGNIPQMAEDQFDMMVKAHLCSLTVNGLKSIILAQPNRPHILHYLRAIRGPQLLIKNVNTEVWGDLAASLNTWETLCLTIWVSGLSWGSPGTMGLFRDEVQPGNTIPGISHENLGKAPSVTDADLNGLKARLKDQGNLVPKEAFTYIPALGSPSTSYSWMTAMNKIDLLPWPSAIRTLVLLWRPTHREFHQVQQPSDQQFTTTSDLLPPEQSQIVFIVGSPGSGEQDFLEEAFSHPQSSDPLVDIIIIPESDGLSFKSLWVLGPQFRNDNDSSFSSPFKHEELMANIPLPLQDTLPLFQNWAACWKAKHKSVAYHPHFLFHGLHALSLEHQGVLLNLILLEGGLSHPTGGPPLFITITSLPTWALADKLDHFSGPRVYYINLDDMKADPALLEAILVCWGRLLPLKFSKLARILASSPRLGHHLKMIRQHLSGLGIIPGVLARLLSRLEPIFAVPEAEAWQLIDQHFGDPSLEV